MDRVTFEDVIGIVGVSTIIIILFLGIALMGVRGHIDNSIEQNCSNTNTHMIE
jgi:hypothetical protein